MPVCGNYLFFELPKKIVLNPKDGGMGYWTRSNVELCILATKGHPKRINAAVHQVIVSHIEEHSKKPQEARERIVSLMGDLPRIELFARQSTPGWDVWGNEVDSSISFP